MKGKMSKIITSLSRQSSLTLIGVVLIKISTGSISCWGSINLYILSYFYYKEYEINQYTNSILILLNVIPISILMLFASKLSQKFGNEKVIRLCSIIFLTSPFVIYFSFTFSILAFFGMFLPVAAFSIASIPVMNSLWTQFPDNKNTATAIAVICFGLGGAFWNYLFTINVNPHNQTASVHDEKLSLSFFSKTVSQNVPSCMKLGYLVCGGLYVIGAFLVKKNTRYEDSSVSADTIQLNLLSSPTNIMERDQQIQQINLKKDSMPLSKALLDHRFVCIFLISMFSGLFQIFLNLNLKIIYLPLIHDDRFLVYCAILSSSVSILGSFVWGMIADRHKFRSVLICFSIYDLLVKIYGCFATTKSSLALFFILIGFGDKAMLTIIGPGLVKIFGIQTATHLLPYKGISIFLGFLISPIGYILLSKSMNPFNYLRFLALFSLVTIFLSTKLQIKKRVEHQKQGLMPDKDNQIQIR